MRGSALDDLAGVRSALHAGAAGEPLEGDVVALLEVLALSLLDTPVDGAVLAEQVVGDPVEQREHEGANCDDAGRHGDEHEQNKQKLHEVSPFGGM